MRPRQPSPKRRYSATKASCTQILGQPAVAAQQVGEPGQRHARCVATNSASVVHAPAPRGAARRRRDPHPYDDATTALDPLHAGCGRGSPRAGNLLACPQQFARSVALVTLGCARNEVDSEELAGRLGAGGWALTDGRRRRRRRGRQHLRFHRLGQEGLDRHAARRGRHRHEGRRGRLPGRALRRPARPVAARGRRRARLRLLRRHRRPPRRRRRRPAGHAARAPRPAHAAARHARSAPGRAIEVALPGHAWLPTSQPARGSTTRRRLPQAGVGLRPPLHLLRHPVLPRLVRLPAAGRRARRGAVARLDGARELVLVSENSTSYGKDLGDLRALETLLPQLAGVDGVERIRVSTCSRPSCARACSRSSRPRRASRRTSTCPSSTRARPCCGG